MSELTQSDIITFLARHISTANDIRDALTASHFSADIKDTMVARHRRNMLEDLSPLINADPEDIYAAFQHFGLSETAHYLSLLAGESALLDHKPLALAALKLGHDNYDDAQVAAVYKSLGNLDRMNLHMPMMRPFDNQISDFLEYGDIELSDIPFKRDLSYITNILYSRNIPQSPEAIPLQVSRQAFEHVLNHFESKGQMLTADDEIKMAGILIIACRALPQQGLEILEKWRDDNHETTLVDILRAEQVAWVCAGDEYGISIQDIVDTLLDLERRIERYADTHELFRTPVRMVLRLFEKEFEQKCTTALGVTAILTPPSPQPS